MLNVNVTVVELLAAGGPVLDPDTVRVNVVIAVELQARVVVPLVTVFVRAKLVGVKVHDSPVVGVLVSEKLTVPVNPPVSVTVIVEVAC